jgi:hypothetical protein
MVSALRGENYAQIQNRALSNRDAISKHNVPLRLAFILSEGANTTSEEECKESLPWRY